MKRFTFYFLALRPDSRYESTVPADDLVEAYEALSRNVCETTGIPKQCWHLVKTVEA